MITLVFLSSHSGGSMKENGLEKAGPGIRDGQKEEAIGIYM